jgi:hypothetical protein
MSTWYRSVLLAIALSLFGAISVANAQWMNLVPATQANPPQPFLTACFNMNQWPTVKSVTASLGAILSDFAVSDSATLASCFATMSSAGLKLTMEAAPLQPTPQTPGGCGLASDCFWNHVHPQLTRLIGLGAPPIRVRMQEPLTTATYYAQWNQNDVVNQVLVFLQLMRAYFPSVKVTLIEAYPFNSGPTLNWFMAAVTAGAQSIGIQPPDEFELDWDPYAPGWSYTDIGSMFTQAHSVGWTFAVIFTGGPCGGCTDDGIWYAGVMEKGLGIWSEAGLTLDNYTFESWEQYIPSQTIPETSQLTFMGTVEDFRAAGYFPR